MRDLPYASHVSSADLLAHRPRRLACRRAQRVHWPDAMTLATAEIATREAPPLGQIVHGPITFVSHCERHGLPFFGKAYVGYVPTSERIGPSALRQMVKRAARHGESALEMRLASMLQVFVHPAGVASVIRTSHDCLGPQLIEEGRSTTTWRGRYRADRSLRAEFLSLCQRA